MPDRADRVRNDSESPSPAQDPLERNQPDPLLRPRLGSFGVALAVFVVIVIAGLVAYGWGR